MKKNNKIICAGGGTLGSVTPLLAVIDDLKTRGDFEFEWWGTKEGPEQKIVEAAGIKFKAISSGKLRRYFSWENFVDLGRIFLGFVESLWSFGLDKPAIVLTAGGYVAVPIGYAAYLYDIPLLVHQEDVRPGLANKLLTPVADMITVTFKKSLVDYPIAKTKLVGNPVRPEFLNPPTKQTALAKLNLSSDQPVVMVMGGGTGSEFLNQLINESLDDLLVNYQIIHLTGLGKYNEPKNIKGYHVESLTSEIIYHLVAADVVISRAGLATISELSALAKPAVIVPLIDTHQEDNASYLADQQAAIVLKQSDLTPKVLIATLNKLLGDKGELTVLSQNIHSLMPKDSAKLMSEEILKYI